MQGLQVAANILCFKSNKGHAGQFSTRLRETHRSCRGLVISHVTELWFKNMQLSVWVEETLKRPSGVQRVQKTGDDPEFTADLVL